MMAQVFGCLPPSYGDPGRVLASWLQHQLLWLFGGLTAGWDARVVQWVMPPPGTLSSHVQVPPQVPATASWEAAVMVQMPWP